MGKKLFSVLISLSIAILCFSLPALADETNLIYNGSFEEVTGGVANGSHFGFGEGLVLNTLGEAQDGYNYIGMPSASSNFSITLPVTQNKNYVFSFWGKTSVVQGINVKMYSYVSNNGWYEWTEYCNAAQIPYIHLGEASFEQSVGTASTDGGAWKKNSFEIHVPHDATNVIFYISSNGGADEFRAVDNFSLVESEYNLVLNSGFNYTYASNPGAYSTDSDYASSWLVHPGEHYDGKFNLMTEENGNQYLLLKSSDNNNNTWRGMILQQPVHLYEGYYKVSFKVMCLSGSIGFMSFRPQDSGTTNFTERSVMGNNFGATNGWNEYTVYFKATAKGRFFLSFGNVWFPGQFSYDDVKLTRVDESEVNYYGSLSTYVDGNGVTDVKHTPVGSIAAGGKVKVMGTFVPKTTEAESAKMFSVVYKHENGIDKIESISVKDVSTSGGNIVHVYSDELTIPQKVGNETYFVKTFVWDSFDNVSPYMEKSILN